MSDEYIEAYKKFGSCSKAAKALGTYPQKVHRHLVKVGYDISHNKQVSLSDEEKKVIRTHYKKYNKRGELNLDDLAEKINRGKSTICIYAASVGLTSYERQLTEERKKEHSFATKKWIKENGHPRGHLGMKHTEETKRKISENSFYHARKKTEEEKSNIALKAAKTRERRGVRPVGRGSWKSEWATINGKRRFYRSRWELNYAHYLEWLRKNENIKEWEHEPKTFWFENIKRGVRSYLPDFKITNKDGSHEWHEVKGWMDARSKTKLKRFAKYYPEEKLILIQKKQYQEIKLKISPMIKEWKD